MAKTGTVLASIAGFSAAALASLMSTTALAQSAPSDTGCEVQVRTNSGQIAIDTYPVIPGTLPIKCSFGGPTVSYEGVITKETRSQLPLLMQSIPDGTHLILATAWTLKGKTPIEDPSVWHKLTINMGPGQVRDLEYLGDAKGQSGLYEIAHFAPENTGANRITITDHKIITSSGDMVAASKCTGHTTIGPNGNLIPDNFVCVPEAPFATDIAVIKQLDAAATQRLASYIGILANTGQSAPSKGLTAADYSRPKLNAFIASVRVSFNYVRDHKGLVP